MTTVGTVSTGSSPTGASSTVGADVTTGASCATEGATLGGAAGEDAGGTLARGGGATVLDCVTVVV
ncbi:MAG: hypothetical protein ACSLFA_18905, partial [Mycobacterium sp.]